MNNITLVLAIIIIGAHLITFIALGRVGALLMYQVHRSIMSRVFEFGCLLFTAHGVVFSLYFLLSFMPSNNLIHQDCLAGVDCRLMLLMTRLNEHRLNYASAAAIAFTLGFIFHSLGRSKFASKGQ